MFARVTQRTVTAFAERTFAHLMSLSPKFHVQRNTGSLIRDVERGTSGIGGQQRNRDERQEKQTRRHVGRKETIEEIAGDQPDQLVVDALEALDMEYRLARRLHHSSDFIEGVRAQVVDKDRSPQWSPATLAEVADAAVAAHFTTLGVDELGLART